MTTQTGSRHVWSDEDRRARLVRRHHLVNATRAQSPEEIATSLMAIHATDPATVFLSVIARLDDPDPVARLETALYDEKTLVRMHGMRKTIFVFPQALRAAVHHSTTSTYAARQRKELIRDLQTGDPAWDEAWLEELEAEIVTWLANEGEANGTAISTAIPRLRQNIIYGAGTKSEATQGIASRVLRSMGNEGRIVRGRPLGSWISRQYRWAAAPPMEAIDPLTARAEILRHWLATYGPGTLDDMKWWTGWAMRDVKAAIARLDTEEVQLNAGTGFVLAGEAEPEEPLAHDLTLLPALDSTAMGYRQRDFYLDPAFVPALFDYSGNIGPTIWWGGRIVGGWAKTKAGPIATRWLTDVPHEAEIALEREIARLMEMVGPVTFTSAFPTPLEKELATQSTG